MDKRFFLIIMGLVIGSFLNVVIYRIPLKKKLFIDRSKCDHCQKILQVIDLIPIFSWIITKGKCRYCRQTILLRYPLIELINTILYVLIYEQYHATMEAVIYCLFFSAMLVLAFIDYDTKEVPLQGIITLIILGILSCIWISNIVFYDRCIGLLILSVPMIIISLLMKESIGGGDIICVATQGFLLGTIGIIITVFIAYLSAGIYALYQMGKGRANRKMQVPMLPFFMIGNVIYVLLIHPSPMLMI